MCRGTVHQTVRDRRPCTTRQSRKSRPAQRRAAARRPPARPVLADGAHSSGPFLAAFAAEFEPAVTIGPFQVVYIATGARLPPAFDAVIAAPRCTTPPSWIGEGRRARAFG